jgi:hypothetical protein
LQSEHTVINKASVIVMTLVGNTARHGDPLWGEIDQLPAPPGFRWCFVAEGPFAVQVRSILRMDASAVVVWVGEGDAIERAGKLIARLLGTGLPVVIAIAELHNPSGESALRQAGAVYICANEAPQRLGEVLESILAPPSLLVNPKTVEFSQEVKMDAS